MKGTANTNEAGTDGVPDYIKQMFSDRKEKGPTGGGYGRFGGFTGAKGDMGGLGEKISERLSGKFSGGRGGGRGNMMGGKGSMMGGKGSMMGGRGAGGKKQHGKMGVKLLETIEACEDDIVMTCSLDFDFELDDLKARLEEKQAAAEEKKEEMREEHEARHAALVKACPALVEECGVPTELPGRVEGERPDNNQLKEALDCIKSKMKEDPTGIEESCSAHLEEMKAEREDRKEEWHANAGERERERPSKEMVEQLKALRVCLQEDVKPFLEEGSMCLAALTRPDKEKEVDEEEKIKPSEMLTKSVFSPWN